MSDDDPIPRVLCRGSLRARSAAARTCLASDSGVDGRVTRIATDCDRFGAPKFARGVMPEIERRIGERDEERDDGERPPLPPVPPSPSGVPLLRKKENRVDDPPRVTGDSIGLRMEEMERLMLCLIDERAASSVANSPPVTRSSARRCLG